MNSRRSICDGHLRLTTASFKERWDLDFDHGRTRSFGAAGMVFPTIRFSDVLRFPEKKKVLQLAFHTRMVLSFR